MTLRVPLLTGLTAAAHVTGAGAAGVLPAPVPDVVAGAVEVVSPFDLPDSADVTVADDGTADRSRGDAPAPTTPPGTTGTSGAARTRRRARPRRSARPPSGGRAQRLRRLTQPYSGTAARTVSRDVHARPVACSGVGTRVGVRPARRTAPASSIASTTAAPPGSLLR